MKLLFEPIASLVWCVTSFLLVGVWSNLQLRSSHSGVGRSNSRSGEGSRPKPNTTQPAQAIASATLYFDGGIYSASYRAATAEDALAYEVEMGLARGKSGAE
jgi:hypothetical protein